MPQYMLILGGTDKELVAKNREITIKKYGEWTEKLIHAKRLKHAHKLKDAEGRRLRLTGGSVIDGPFTESKETVGGYYIVDASNYDEAVTLAKECPVVLYQGGYVEIREIER